MSIIQGVKILTAVTATGVGGVLDHSIPVRNHSVHAVVTGDPTAVVFDLEGSLDGVNFATLATFTFDAGEITADHKLDFILNKPVIFVRANLTTLTAGTTPTVTVFYAGEGPAKQRNARVGQY